MSGLIHRLLDMPGWLVLLVTGLVVFAEDALALGFVIPGEAVALLAGAAANLGHVPLVGVLIVVVSAAIAGDSVGYEVGRHLGPRVLRLPVLVRHRREIDAARSFLARRGGAAVFLGRWTAFFRAVLPFLAGTVAMPYRTFLGWNVLGGLTCGGRRPRCIRYGTHRGMHADPVGALDVSGPAHDLRLTSRRSPGIGKSRHRCGRVRQGRRRLRRGRRLGSPRRRRRCRSR